ncbi:MAG TPA: hypothetical protein VMW41_06690 [Candidatus Bathyarchaeia archaeon]|nr:hypothetical protein [Candidatus Bathyarchaeia archaeon]
MAATDKELGVASLETRRKVIKRLFGKERKFPVVEIPQIPEIPPEIEKAQPVTGAATQLPQAVIDDQTGQVLVSSPGDQGQIVLPLTEEEIEKGLTYQVIDSIRWLAEWCVRLAKRVGLVIRPKKRKKG